MFLRRLREPAARSDDFQIRPEQSKLRAIDRTDGSLHDLHLFQDRPPPRTHRAVQQPIAPRIRSAAILGVSP